MVRLWQKLWRAEVVIPALCAACLFWNLFPYLQLFNSTPAYLNGLDNNYYFAWVRSFVIDGDVDFENDLAYLFDHPGVGGTGEAIREEIEEYGRTDSGLIPNRYGVGSGVLALPFVWVTHLALHLLYESPDPFSRWYPAAFVASGIIWGFIGLYFSLLIVRRFYEPKIAAQAVGMAALGLSLGHYLWFEPTLAHAPGFGVLSLFVWLCLKWGDQLSSDENSGDAIRWMTPFVMGLSMGVAVAIRYTNVVFVAVPFLIGMQQLLGANRDERRALTVVGLKSLVFAFIGAVIAFSPQLIAWKALFGSYFYYSYEGHVVYPWPKFLVQILVGGKNGLFLWTPLALVACAGIVFGVKDRPAVFLPGLAVLCAIAWIYGGWELYHLGHSFGMRGFAEASMFFMLGFAEVLRRIQERWSDGELPGHLLRGLILFLIAWNIYLIFAYRAHVQPPGESFVGWELFAQADRVFMQMAQDFKLHRIAAVLGKVF